MNGANMCKHFMQLLGKKGREGIVKGRDKCGRGLGGAGGLDGKK